MKKSLNQDLIDASEILENFVKVLETLPQADLIDLAARLKPIVKNCELIDKFTKEMVKVKLRDKEGDVLGGMFKANLKLIPVERLDQTAFKEARPSMFQQYVRENNETRISFVVR